MRRTPTPARTGLLVLAAALAAAPPAGACGYHDPSALNVGMLNLAYPDALFVRTAVWMAQREGVVAGHAPAPAADAPVAGSARILGLLDTVAALGQWRDRLGAGLDAQAVPAFSVLLLKPMLWSRYERAGPALVLQPHTPGPAPADVVVVTDEPVVQALVDGRLDPRDAIDRGLVRFYGSPGDVAAVAALLGRPVPQRHAGADSAPPPAAHPAHPAPANDTRRTPP